MASRDKIVIVRPEKTRKFTWAKALKTHNPDLDIEIYPEDTDRENTAFLLVWNPPEGIYQQYPNLKVVASMGAGIKHITKDTTIPDNVVVTKVNDPLLRRDLSVFVLGLCLNYMRRFTLYAAYQQQKIWKPRSYKRPEDLTVGIMGVGAIGREIGKTLADNGFAVTGWSRTPKQLAYMQTFHGDDQRKEFLTTADILVCVLPLTPETQGVLNAELFDTLPEKAYLINVGRGAELVEEDLLQALDKGQLSGAALDVFQEEPLPQDHPFWGNDKILITPHTASTTDAKSVSKKVLENYEHMKKGEPLEDVIDVKRGY